MYSPLLITSSTVTIVLFPFLSTFLIKIGSINKDVWELLDKSIKLIILEVLNFNKTTQNNLKHNEHIRRFKTKSH
ncbi:hypothetical protein KL86DYS1_10464 [uncultured Dysgonomonas sp.]|uniref:Uncharacterized protein n=1 Tax=uncultured Dysgonomonas sp. TaxID=206096 RepID=A0A212IXI3_9BACT|nr:hypothetical protein KL86DYS1_10464 [uncultured Dysgonomonas sp.]